jgi:hypothetical protein
MSMRSIIVAAQTCAAVVSLGFSAVAAGQQCTVPCTPPLIGENEPCGSNTVNSGCDTPPPQPFLVLRCPEGYCGESWAFNNSQDTDWYRVIVNDSNNDGTEYVCFTLTSEFPAVLELYSGFCGGLTMIAQGESSNCTATSVCACVPAPGQYLIKIYPGTIAGGPTLNGLPCTNPFRHYTVKYDCQSVCPGPGACCYQVPGVPGFLCTVTTQADCINVYHGIWQGSNTSCTPDPCNDPTGACCYVQSDGTNGCTVTTQTDCEQNLLGIYLGDNTTCTPDACDPDGACCYIDAAGLPACTVTTQSHCVQVLHGVYQGDGTTCNPDPCHIGACCFQQPGQTNFNCIMTTQANCATLFNSTWLGVNVNCNMTPDPCNPPIDTGACCYFGAAGPQCVVTTQANCAQTYNGIWQGANTTCTPNPCVPDGACCYINTAGVLTCSIETQSDCLQVLGGTWMGANTTCTPNPCEPDGACCYINPAVPGIQCTITTQSNCTQVLNGIWQGANTTCNPNPCNPTGACCFQDGPQAQILCVVVTQAQCANFPQSVWQGPNTTCTPNPCPESGACCYQPAGQTSTICQIMTQANCAQLNGIWQGVNTFCFPDPCDDCVKPPADMVSWWTLDDGPSSPVANDAGGHPGTPQNGVVMGTAGMVNGAFTFDGIDDFIFVPHHSDHDFNCGPFSADAWVRLAPNSQGGIILEKWGNGFTGWSFLVDPGSSPPGALTLLLGTTNVRCFHTSAPNVITPGAWHHVAFVAHTPIGGNRAVTFYIDGAFAGSSGGPCDCVPSNRPLWIGQGFFGSPWPGKLDEIELFDRELSATEIQSIYAAGSAGKCKHHCAANWDVPYCANTSVLTTTVQICNDSGTAQTYNLALNGTPSVPAAICNGPLIPAANFTVVGGNTVTVPPATCVPVQVQITRPPGLLPGMSSCFSITVTNPANGHVSVCYGSVVRTQQWCWIIIECCLDPIGVGTTVTATFDVTNNDDPDGTFNYVMDVMGPDMTPNDAVRLNGLPPGVPVKGTLTLAPGETAKVPVDIAFQEHKPFVFYDMLVSDSDAPGEGVYNPVMNSLTLHSAPGPFEPVCLADIAPSPNGNGVVNVDDLLGVINGWGQCPAVPPPGTCPADISPPGGNGVVNVDDLLAVINAWGPCP